MTDTDSPPLDDSDEEYIGDGLTVVRYPEDVKRELYAQGRELAAKLGGPPTPSSAGAELEGTGIQLTTTRTIGGYRRIEITVALFGHTAQTRFYL